MDNGEQQYLNKAGSADYFRRGQSIQRLSEPSALVVPLS
jgi:hypothetical protein